MPKRVVLKFGSGILTSPESAELDAAQMEALVAAVASLHKEDGYECVVVSSGAVAAGLPGFGLRERPTDLATLQACAAVGQTRLMHYYETLFRQYKLNVGQLLLTHEDLKPAERRLNVCNTLEKLLSFRNTIPVINENDSVAVEELRYGDNDMLSADVACLIQADALVLLTTVDGLLPPNADAIIPLVEDLDLVMGFATQERGVHSVGGMVTKLQAVRRVTQAGIEAYIANGRRPNQLIDVVKGRGVATHFKAIPKVS